MQLKIQRGSYKEEQRNTWKSLIFRNEGSSILVLGFVSSFLELLV